MQKLLIAVFMLSLAACGNNQEDKKTEDDGLLSTDIVNNPASADGTDTELLEEMPTMDFKDTVHHFGKLQEGEVGTYDFDFKNNGKLPLIISAATGSCGCTVPDFPREPVAPGASGTIKVRFDSEGRYGHQEKSVTINTNSKRGVHMLYIKAEVAARDSR